MIYELYKKQVEAWKEMGEEVLMIVARRLGNVSWEKIKEAKPNVEKLLLLSRHKDTIELIEAEIERKKRMRKELNYPKEMGLNQALFYSNDKGYNQCLDEDIAYLEEQLKLIKNEQ